MALSFEAEITSIPKFYSGKSVFITGGSGYIGKILIEKLLRSCPDIENIYVLLRRKREKTPEDRVVEMTSIPLFDLLRETNNNALRKIIPINGDVAEIGLGISKKDRDVIIDNVQIIFHVAASVRFDDPLKKAVFCNIRSTREAVELAKELKNPVCFTLVSTAYCHLDQIITEEKLYSPTVNWQEVVRIAEEMDEHTLQIFSQKFINPLPNTYVYTKALAEQVVNDLCIGKIPAIILRPSMVVCSIKEPITGWVENFNGPYVVVITTGSGIGRIFYANPNVIIDHVFVDNVAKALIIATWKKAQDKDNLINLSIYNACSEIRYPIFWYRTLSKKLLDELPLEKKIWAPVDPIPITTCFYYFYAYFMIFQVIPAIVIDSLLKLAGKKPLLLLYQRKFYMAEQALFPFTSVTFQFKRDNYLGLESELLESDLETFSIDLNSDVQYDDRWDVFRIALLGMKKYILKEDVNISLRTRIIDKSLKILNKIIKLAWILLFVYIIISKFDLMEKLSETLHFINGAK